MFESVSNLFNGIVKPKDNFYAAKYGVTLDLKPANEYERPEKRIIDLEKAYQWVESHPTQEGKDLAQKLLSNIRVLSFEQFLDSLSKLAEEVDKQVQDDDYVLLVDPGRSSEYVASLISQYLKRKPAAVLNIASDYYSELQSAKLKAVKKVVFLDDGVFSGSQITAYIRNHIRPEYHQKAGREVVVGVCYSTPRARGLIEKALPEGATSIFIDQLPVLEDILTEEELKLQESLCEDVGLIPYGQVLTQLPHSNIDAKSFPANVLEGSVIVGKKGPNDDIERVGRFISKIKKPYNKE